MADLCSVALGDFTLSPGNGIFSAQELDKVAKLVARERTVSACPSQSCHTPLYFGLFFDGTKNNYEKNEVTI